MSLLSQISHPDRADRYGRIARTPANLTPESIRQILDLGADGDLEAQDELFNLMEDTWDRLRTNLNKAKNSILKLEPTLQPAGSDEASSELAAFAQEHLLDFEPPLHLGYNNFSQTVYDILDSIGRGITVLEIIWQYEDRTFSPLGTLKLPADLYGFRTLSTQKRTTDLNHLVLFPEGKRSPAVEFTDHPHKFILSVYKTKSGALGANALLRCLAQEWYKRMIAAEWMLEKAEIFGSPLRWATYEEGTSQEDLLRVETMLQNMGNASWGLFPKSVDLDIQSGLVSGVTGAAEPAERLIAAANKACDLLLLGQSLTGAEGSQGGSYALGQVQRQVELDLYQTYASFTRRVVERQLLRPLIALNFPKAPRSQYPRLELDIPRPDVAEAKARVDQVLFQEMGLPVAREYLYQRHVIPEPGPDDELFDVLSKYLSERRKHAEAERGGEVEPEPPSPSSPPTNASPSPDNPL